MLQHGLQAEAFGLLKPEELLGQRVQIFRIQFFSFRRVRCDKFWSVRGFGHIEDGPRVETGHVVIVVHLHQFFLVGLEPFFGLRIVAVEVLKASDPILRPGTVSEWQNVGVHFDLKMKKTSFSSNNFSDLNVC